MLSFLPVSVGASLHNLNREESVDMSFGENSLSDTSPGKLTNLNQTFDQLKFSTVVMRQ